MIKIYEKIKQFLANKAKEDIEIIKSKRVYSGELLHFQHTLRWFNLITSLNKEEKEILFGERQLTIEYIRDSFLEHLEKEKHRIIVDRNSPEHKDMTDKEFKEYEEDEYCHGDYDSAGYCSPNGFYRIVTTIEGMDLYMLQSIVEDGFIEDYEVDLDGGRSYLTRNCSLDIHAFAYLYYNHNDLVKDSYSEYYPKNMVIPTEEQYQQWYLECFNQKYTIMVDQWNSMVKNISDQFGNNPIFKDKVNEIKNHKLDYPWIFAKLREGRINDVLQS